MKEELNMAKIIGTRKIHCRIRHIDAVAVDWSDGHTSIKCVFRKYCDKCPFESE